MYTHIHKTYASLWFFHSACVCMAGFPSPWKRRSRTSGSDERRSNLLFFVFCRIATDLHGNQRGGDCRFDSKPSQGGLLSCRWLRDHVCNRAAIKLLTCMQRVSGMKYDRRNVIHHSFQNICASFLSQANIEI